MSIESLQISMASLVKVLRDLLSNMKEEQQAVLIQDMFSAQVVVNQRSAIFNSMTDYRQAMMRDIDQLLVKKEEFFEGDLEREKLMRLSQIIGEDQIELLTLRDQILALMDSINNQNDSISNSGIDSVAKESHSYYPRPAKRRLQPKIIAVTKKKVLVKTLEIPEE